VDKHQRYNPRYAENELEMRWVKAGASLVLVLLLAGLIMASLLRAPEVDWVLGLTAATIVMGVSIVIGARQWLRDRPRSVGRPDSFVRSSLSRDRSRHLRLRWNQEGLTMGAPGSKNDEQEPHPDYARGQHNEKQRTDHSDFARGQRQKKFNEHEGDFAEGQGRERHPETGDHGDFARGQRHQKPAGR